MSDSRHLPALLTAALVVLCCGTVPRAAAQVVNASLEASTPVVCNGRVGFRTSPEDQEQVAQEIVAELGRGRLVQLLVTNWPKIELNHTVVVYAYHVNGPVLELTVWDPNNPESPGLITFDTAERRFWATRVYDTEFGDIRAFRMYYSWFL